jgi:aspartyl-tRNA(Asn)/glutamyl-tRNA(Gln) amidotransferase subunit B
VSDSFEMVVGLEVHVQLRTRTKTFCNCATVFGAAPNINTCPVCLGLPGALPVLNVKAVELAVRTAHALRCTIHDTSTFARKNYFYPDLPKGYQITQYDRPLATGGFLIIGHDRNDSPIQVGITRVHMEEDAGKSVHDRFPGETAIDLNRAGVPLIEIVSEPELRSAMEAGAYLHSLRQLLEYLDVSDVSMEEGSLRVDANISVREAGDTKLGTRTEVKNMNSFSAVEKALEAEFSRQCEVIGRGDRVVQQTMLWDGVRSEVRPSRVKEGSQDYRYFPDPDLPPLILAPDWVKDVCKDMPELPADRRKRFAKEYELGEYDVELLTSYPALSEYYEGVARHHGNAKTAANWVMGEVLATLKNTGHTLDNFPVRPDDLASLLDMIRDDLVSNSAAKRIFGIMVETGKRPTDIAGREGLLQERNDQALSTWIEEVLAENPDAAQRFIAGEKKLKGVLTGLVMTKSGGRADPRRVSQLLSERAST